MGLPQEKDIRLPLLTVIADAGGELRMRDAIAGVEAYFPQLSDDDKRLKHASGVLVWPNRVQFVRQHLVVEGYLFREPRGLWRITPEGKAYVEGGVIVQPPPPPHRHLHLLSDSIGNSRST